jgi:hypothetical protein
MAQYNDRNFYLNVLRYWGREIYEWKGGVIYHPPR